MRNANEGVSLTEAILAIRGIDKYASYHKNNKNHNNNYSSYYPCISFF